MSNRGRRDRTLHHCETVGRRQKDRDNLLAVVPEEILPPLRLCRTMNQRTAVASAVCCWMTIALLSASNFVSGFSLVPPPLHQSITSSTNYFASSRRRQHQQQRQQQQQQQHYQQSARSAPALFIIPPPGSGYTRPEDDTYKSELPDTYEPMMAYPGTMRPGMTPENMPFQDLPIADDDPDPVPWPHFQQIEWHHRWSEPPHEHPGTMENFIAARGRWATPEQEAAMRAGARRDFRERQEQAEQEKRDTVITDDEEDDDEDADVFDDDYEEKEEPVALGDGIFGKLGSDADRAETVKAVSPGAERTEEERVDPTADEGLDDFLLDLGLDVELGEDESSDADADDDGDDEDEGGPVSKGTDGVTATINVDDDEDELSSLGLDDVDDLDNDVSTVPLDDFSDSETLDTEDIFDEGGFDFDDGDFGGDDDW